MNISELKKILQNNGIVGAGGAGFPTYAKLDERAEIIILNCAECEPLLKLHRQLLKEYAQEIMQTFHLLAQTVGAKKAIIGIKEEYAETVEAVKAHIDTFPEMEIRLLESVYPTGDEVVLIYEATGKVIRPGGIPIEEGVAVFNVETVYNIGRAVNKGMPVTDKVISVVGEVEHPLSVRVPIGMAVEDVVALAGKTTIPKPVYFIGGPMMGFIGKKDMPVTKTTNAILVLSEEHAPVRKKQSNSSIELKRAASVCCQCETCTDMCPRHLLGHPIEPHMFMRSAANQDFRDSNVFLNTFFCCSCGICEMYACPQGLSPRTLITEYKNGLRKAGVKPPANPVQTGVKAAREYRKTPEIRLETRLGLSAYDVPVALKNECAETEKVKVKLSQHIGAPAVAVVKPGDSVMVGDVIGKAADGLSVTVHASITGKVMAVDSTEVTIQKMRQEA